ncbi:MAG: sigma-70 family RNA polymerase sigma factor [Planctomycetota bacterium]
MLTTRGSLLGRIRDTNDADAWAAFVDIYGPLVYRYGRRKGLQDSDAADLSQAVLTEVARCIDRFSYDPSLGRFRNWLMVIARHQLSSLADKHVRHAGSGDSRVAVELHQLPADDDLEERFESEYREHLFRWAADKVRDEVEESTWLAFWRTSVEGAPPQKVADELEKKVGSIYVAKSRIVLRIRELIASVDDR